VINITLQLRTSFSQQFQDKISVAYPLKNFVRPDGLTAVSSLSLKGIHRFSTYLAILSVLQAKKKLARDSDISPAAQTSPSHRWRGRQACKRGRGP
jgi:hypothetical protein